MCTLIHQSCIVADLIESEKPPGTGPLLQYKENLVSKYKCKYNVLPEMHAESNTCITSNKILLHWSARV